MNEGRKAAQGSPRKRTTRNTLPITRDHAFPLIIPLAQSSAQPQSVQVAVAFRAQLAAQPTTHTESPLSVHSHHCASSLLAKPHPSLHSTRFASDSQLFVRLLLRVPFESRRHLAATPRRVSYLCESCPVANSECPGTNPASSDVSMSPPSWPDVIAVTTSL